MILQLESSWIPWIWFLTHTLLLLDHLCWLLTVNRTETLKFKDSCLSSIEYENTQAKVTLEWCGKTRKMTLIKRLVVSILIGALVIILFLQQMLQFKDRDKQLKMENESFESISSATESVKTLQYSFHESCNCSRSLPNLKPLKKAVDFGKLHELPDGSFVGISETNFKLLL